MIPKKFEYNPVRRDESESLVQKSVMDELEARKQKLKERLATLKVDSEGTNSHFLPDMHRPRVENVTFWRATRCGLAKNCSKRPKTIVK